MADPVPQFLKPFNNPIPAMNLRCIFCLGLILFGGPLLANNIQVTNVQLVGQNTANHTYQIQFDMSWENSWRTSTLESNWDAAWVFIKFSKLDVDVWNHATLNLTGAVAPGGASAQVVDNSGAPGIGVGAFIYRSVNGQGNVNYTGVQLQWNYGSNGIADNELVEVCVQAIEMVFVPQGAFYLGDGQSSAQAGFELGLTGAPYQVTTDNAAITLGGGGATSLGNNNHTGQTSTIADDFSDATSFVLPAAYPMGFSAFYSMKYEISQGQFASFLSKLTPSQAAARYPAFNGNSQYTIAQDVNRYYAAVPTRACNYLSWADCAAYLDWACLRPMSETEYEKACRGSRYVVANEYAWGNNCLTAQLLQLTDPNGEGATVSNLVEHCGNAWYVNTSAAIDGPTRCGLFAASSANHSREESGASYYGIMELSGNVTEFVVGLGLPQGRVFDGLHGNGGVSPSGLADVGNWPSNSTAYGIGSRGGAWSYSPIYLRASTRLYSNSWVTSRSGEIGGRGVRTAP